MHREKVSCLVERGHHLLERSLLKRVQGVGATIINSRIYAKALLIIIGAQQTLSRDLGILPVRDSDSIQLHANNNGNGDSQAYLSAWPFKGIHSVLGIFEGLKDMERKFHSRFHLSQRSHMVDDVASPHCCPFAVVKQAKSVSQDANDIPGIVAAISPSLAHPRVNNC